ncbi:hypothetical protein P7C70_g6034, partial [Phenoliferia sp. Uapishka_3]
MLDVSGSSVIAHYHSEPREHSVLMLSFYPHSGPYNNYLVESKYKKEPFRYHYIIQSPTLANLLKRYHGFYRERLAASHAPIINVSSDIECLEAEGALLSKPELPGGWEELGREALAHRASISREARMKSFLEVEIEYALVSKLAIDIFAPHHSWENLAKDISTYKSSTSPLPIAPTKAQRVWSWLSGSFAKRSLASATTEVATIIPRAPSFAASGSINNAEPRKFASSYSFVESPPTYPSPPPYSPSHSSESNSFAASPKSRSTTPSPSQKIISTFSAAPITGLSSIEVTPSPSSRFRSPKEVRIRKGDFSYTFGPRAPMAAPEVPFLCRVLDVVGDVLDPFQGLIEALV